MRQDTKQDVSVDMHCERACHCTTSSFVCPQLFTSTDKKSSNKVERQISHFKKKHEPVQDLFRFLSNPLSFLKFANRLYNNLSKDGMRIPMYTHVQFCDLEGRESRVFRRLVGK